MYLVGFVNEMKETNITCNIHLTLKFIFKSSKDVDEEIEMFLKSKNITVAVGRSTVELIRFFYKVYKFFIKLQSIKKLVEKMKGSDFVFDFVYRLHYKSHKITYSYGS